ncbi:hypothetical protein K3495_g9860 [Podosphaera aphanis]|nr:hypothetical protein K3495_g9860 [Podosphaera aphanis]
MAEPPTPSLLHYHPQYENPSQSSAEQAVCEQRRNSCFEYDMEIARPDMGSQCRTDETMAQPHSSFTTAGFTSYSQNAPPQNIEGNIPMGKIQLMLQDLYKAVTEKVVMENAALFTALEAESAKSKCTRFKPSRSTRTTKCTSKRSYNSSETASSVTNDDNGINGGKKSTPKGKLVEWTTVSRNGTKTKNKNSREKWPSQLKNVKESKRRIIFIRKSDSPGKPPSTAQEILHAINMKLLSMKVPAHLRLIKLRYNERGNLTGLTTAQTTADAMVTRVKEKLLKTVLRFDAEITEISANQQWIYIKAHGVELGRYCNANGLNQIREEIAAGPPALELPFAPPWVSGH